MKAFTLGGVVLFDEFDSYGEDARLCLNSALSGGMMSLPTGEVVQAHPDFRCIAAGNTFGMGADSTYNERVKLDGATKSRFPVTLTWQYDTELEIAMAGDCPVYLAWTVEIQAVRIIAEIIGLDISAEARMMKAGAALLQAGMKIDKVRDITYLAGLDDDQRKQVQAAIAKSVKAEV